MRSSQAKGAVVRPALVQALSLLAFTQPCCPCARVPCACSKVDQLAAKVGAAPDLVSRAGLALGEVLTAGAADGGHSYLPWSVLEPRGRRLLSDTGEHSGEAGDEYELVMVSRWRGWG